MQDPYFLSLYQAMSPTPMHAGYVYQPQWPVASQPQLPHVATYGPPPPRLDSTSTIRRVHQRSLGRHPHHSHRALPWPSARSPVHRPRSSYPTLTVSPIHLSRKPKDWRGSYKSPSKGGLGKYFQRIGLTIPKSASPRVALRVHPALAYQPERVPVLSHDLRVHPISGYDLELRTEDPPLTPAQLYLRASSPRSARISLWHRSLPWSLTVRASAPGGVTVEDLLVGVYDALQTPIRHHEYYTVALTAEDRERVDMAFQRRCRGAPAEIRKGVRRVDFLGEEVCFVGVQRAGNGTWEMRTATPERQRMVLE